MTRVIHASGPDLSNKVFVVKDMLLKDQLQIDPSWFTKVITGDKQELLQYFFKNSRMKVTLLNAVHSKENKELNKILSQNRLLNWGKTNSTTLPKAYWTELEELLEVNFAGGMGATESIPINYILALTCTFII